MDVDLLDLAAGLRGADASSDSDGEVGEGVDQDARGDMQVGKRLELPQFGAKCLRDDMSWKGSQVSRSVSLQGGGVARMLSSLADGGVSPCGNWELMWAAY